MDYVPPATEIVDQVIVNEFTMQPNTAQYKGSDYSNVVRVERGIPLEKAFEIAKADESIGYFVYVKGAQMVLEIPQEASFDPSNDPHHLVTLTDKLGPCRIFHNGDVLFFKKEGMWLGTAPGLADAYVK